MLKIYFYLIPIIIEVAFFFLDGCEIITDLDKTAASTKKIE